MARGLKRAQPEAISRPATRSFLVILQAGPPPRAEGPPLQGFDGLDQDGFVG